MIIIVKISDIEIIVEHPDTMASSMVEHVKGVVSAAISLYTAKEQTNKE